MKIFPRNTFSKLPFASLWPELLNQSLGREVRIPIWSEKNQDLPELCGGKVGTGTKLVLCQREKEKKDCWISDL